MKLVENKLADTWNATNVIKVLKQERLANKNAHFVN